MAALKPVGCPVPLEPLQPRPSPGMASCRPSRLTGSFVAICHRATRAAGAAAVWRGRQQRCRRSAQTPGPPLHRCHHLKSRLRHQPRSRRLHSLQSRLLPRTRVSGSPAVCTLPTCCLPAVDKAALHYKVYELQIVQIAFSHTTRSSHPQSSAPSAPRAAPRR